MPCPTCRAGPHRHNCPRCDRPQMAVWLGGDPLEQTEPCRNCLACQSGIRLPAAPGQIGHTAYRLRRLGMDWGTIAALTYPPGATRATASSAETAAKSWARRSGQPTP